MVGHTNALVLVLAFLALSAHSAQIKHHEEVDSQSGQDLNADAIQASASEVLAADVAADKSESSLDDDDDDDDDDAAADEAPSVGPVQATAGSEKKDKPSKPSGLAREEELAKTPSPDGKDVAKAKDELAANLQKQMELEHKIKFLEDEDRSGQEIDASATLVANETDSPAMADMMASMWKEMRKFDVPFYAEHVEQELRVLKHEQHKLEAKLKGSNDKANAKKDGHSKGKDGKKGIASNKGAKLVEAEEPALHDNVGNGVASNVNANMNFWNMSSSGKMEYLAGSIVYIVAGFCLAFMYNKARLKNPKMFAPEVHRDKFHNPKDFAFHIFGCLGSPNVCVMGFCCPCLRWSDTLDQRGLLPYWKAFCAFFLMSVLHSYTWGISSFLVIALGVYYRQKLKASHDIENGTPASIAMDVLLWFCCAPCAIVQEAREESLAQSVGNINV